MSYRILVAEDDPSSLTILRLMLEAGGFEVATARDGEAAWTQLSGGAPFDVCIFDIMMPNLDGLALTKRLREHPRFREEPVLLCTALNDRATVDRAAALAVTGYIVKPFARDQVVKQVRQICEERQAFSKLESLQSTALRLGIDEPLVAGLLGDVVKDTTALVGALRAGPATPGDHGPMIRLNGSKGAAINLGAYGLHQALALLEHQCAGAPGRVDEDALRGVERECARLSSLLAAATPVPATAAASV